MDKYMIVSHEFHVSDPRSSLESFYRKLFDNLSIPAAPDRWSYSPPVRSRLDSQEPRSEILNIYSDCDALCPPSVARSSHPSYKINFEFDLTVDAQNSAPPFQGRAAVDFELEHEDFGFLRSFFRKLIVDILKPTFASLSYSSDYWSKHWFSVDHERGTTEMSVGQNVTNSLPGVYWLTYLSDHAIEKFDLRLEPAEFSEGVGISRVNNRGFIITAYQDGSLSGNEHALKKEYDIRDRLGKESFHRPEEISEEEVLSQTSWKDNSDSDT